LNCALVAWAHRAAVSGVPVGGSGAGPNRKEQFTRAVVQRVTQASVSIGGVTRSAIGPGLLVLVGVEETDTAEDIEWLSGKIVRLRVFDDEQGLMNRSVQDVRGDLLVVSQFTLFASTRKGNRPSYSRAARPEVAIPLYEALVRRLTADSGQQVQTGEFGAEMQVSLINDGPVTILVDTKQRE
jgi:D-aminoacyl-tRNA deacylase